ncbi:MAG: N-acetylneuraminate synthase [Phycisphaeraceae bacterium]|nr:MAG: N-acetylneuraminate synthase [Phycisphaeraceae bacterium]
MANESLESSGPGRTLVIAEIGVNHDGSRGRGLELVDAAAEAGADAVKLQIFEAARLLGAGAGLATYQANSGETNAAAMLERLELSIDDARALVNRARERGLLAIATVFSVELVEATEGLGLDAYKTASPDIVHRPLIERLAHTGKPLIMSTGGAEMDEVKRAAGWAREADAKPPLTLLHCVSSYPTKDDDASLNGVRALGEVFCGDGATGLRALVGYSDHTQSVDTGALAVAAGASALEKHLTHDRSAPGPDHAASLDPGQFAEYVRLVRRAEQMLGPVGKRVQACEREVMAAARQSITSARTIEAGARIEAKDVTVKRPGTGLEPWRMEDVVGRTAAGRIEADAPIREEDLK